eukprot:GFUD01000880.1.p1 GENE.GFUD01000880.1~~GFUD01000880.1.p1  ORF type:complete len:295 (+),score=109.96 GFUD01000880.1:61-885(+)
MHLGLLSLVVVGISCAPHNIIKKSGNFPLIHGDADVASLRALKPRSKKWHLEPPSVTKISKKSQDQGNTQAVSEEKKSHSVFSGVNGNRQGIKQEDQQVQVKRNGEGSVLFPRSAAELAGYVLETGDQASVVQLLERMLTEGKISEEEALAYVENIKRYLDEAEKTSQQPNNEEEKIREILLERHLEEKAMEQKMEEEEAAKAVFMKNMINAEHKENDENESILKINKFLEEALKEGKISKSLYNHLKEALIESVVEGLEKGTNNMDSLDYGQY